MRNLRILCGLALMGLSLAALADDVRKGWFFWDDSSLDRTVVMDRERVNDAVAKKQAQEAYIRGLDLTPQMKAYLLRQLYDDPSMAVTPDPTATPIPIQGMAPPEAAIYQPGSYEAGTRQKKGTPVKDVPSLSFSPAVPTPTPPAQFNLKTN